MKAPGTGFKCGACPSGMKGDGKKCAPAACARGPTDPPAGPCGWEAQARRVSVSVDIRITQTWCSPTAVCCVTADMVFTGRLHPKPCRTRVGDKEWRHGRRSPTHDQSTNNRCVSSRKSAEMHGHLAGPHQGGAECVSDVHLHVQARLHVSRAPPLQICTCSFLLASPITHRLLLRAPIAAIE